MTSIMSDEGSWGQTSFRLFKDTQKMKYLCVIFIV